MASFAYKSLLKPGDILLMLIACMALGWLYAALWGEGGQAAAVQVLVGDDIVHEIALDESRRLEVEGRLGISELVIEPGQVRFHASPCRHKLCINRGWLNERGEVTACLPNGVSLVMIGGDAEAGSGVDRHAW